jgi:hypothetical protein
MQAALIAVLLLASRVYYDQYFVFLLPNVALAPGFVRNPWTQATRTWFARRFVSFIPDRAGRPGLWRARQVSR